MWLACIVRETLGKELADVPAHRITPRLWADWMAFRQGGKLDPVTRRRGNTTINSAVRCAASIFIPRLRPVYKEHGITIGDDATVIQWLPVPAPARKEVDDGLLCAAWAALDRNNLWLAVGLARFTGLRQQEIAAARRDWLIERDGAPYVELRDRPEEGFQHKTGKPYRALILSPSIADHLRAIPPGAPSIALPDGEWIKEEPQRWLRQFMPGIQKPLHRCRGLYADHLAAITEDITLARLAAVKAASEALGHTSTTTTERSYLSAIR